MKWSDGDIERMKEMARDGLTALEASRILKRSEGACHNKGVKLGISWNGHAAKHLRWRIGEGVVLIREEYPFGPRWTTAQRSGETFDTGHCEAFLRYGLIVQEGSHYVAAGR